jgi:uncharacterized protein
MSRAEKIGVPFRNYFLKRMLLLFLIGTIHCFVLWNGDIIMSYAFGGVFLLLIRNWSVKKTITLAILFNVILTGIVFIGNSALDWRVYDYDYGLALIQPNTNSYIEYLSVNAKIAPWVNFLKDMPITLIYTFGNMLIGVVLGKLNFFRLQLKLKRITNAMILLGFSVGVTASYFFHLVMSGELELDIPMLWVPFVLAAGMIVQALGYIALFVRLYQNGFFKKILQGFKYVGKTALSNYISQSVFYLFVFFHCTNSFELFGKVSRAETYVIALGFFILQSVLSHLWLKSHEQGPIEYWWKKMSYKINLNKKNMYKIYLILLCCVAASACSKDDNEALNQDPLIFNFDFTSDNQGWQGDFADYPKSEESIYELEFTQSMLPAPLDESNGSLKQSGNNHSDDLFMFVKKKITGLSANKTYQATFDIEIATNAPDGSVGIGGSPATSVYIKAGITKVEPIKVEDTAGDYRMNIDKGNQSQEGQDMVLIGDFSNGLEDDTYALKSLNNTTPFTITTNENGELWVVIGTDSGFEGTTTIYYNKISIIFELDTQ